MDIAHQAWSLRLKCLLRYILGLHDREITFALVLTFALPSSVFGSSARSLRPPAMRHSRKPETSGFCVCSVYISTICLLSRIYRSVAIACGNATLAIFRDASYRLRQCFYILEPRRIPPIFFMKEIKIGASWGACRKTSRAPLAPDHAACSPCGVPVKIRISGSNRRAA